VPRFNGKVAVVAGASSGIGLAVARRLGSEGAKVVIVGAPVDEADVAPAVEGLRAEGIEVEGLAADIAADGSAEKVIGLARSRFGRLDVLVNNAAAAYFEEFLSTPVDHLDRTLAVNVRGTFLMSQVAARAMVEQGDGGAIVMTASTASFAGEEYQVTYNLSKGAIAELVRSLAIDLAPHRIRVNAVAPGWVATRATQPVIEDPVQWSKHRSRIPLDRPASPDEIAAVHAFLASDDAAYVTGAVVVADGGLTAGFRWSNWLAVEPPPDGLAVGIPDVPTDMHEPRH
jgi:NAD(P)-dependent dehydrogenase (short-subunit alcohol dehydrogenase family)